jgi:hypothetical protein
MTTRGFLLRVIRLGFLLIMVLAAAPIHSAFAQAPVKIGVGWITTPASLVPLLFLNPGVTKHPGKSYMFEPIHYASSLTKSRMARPVTIQRRFSCAKIPGSTGSRT